MQAIVDKTCQYSNYIVQGIVFMSLQLLTHARKPFSYSFYLHHILVRVALIKFIAYRWLQAMTRGLSPNLLNLAGSVPDMTIQFGLTPSSSKNRVISANNKGPITRPVTEKIVTLQIWIINYQISTM